MLTILAVCWAALLPAGAEGQEELPARPQVLSPGDTVQETLFAFTREQVETLATRLRNDSLRISKLRADSSDFQAEIDSLHSALFACGQKVEARTMVAEAEREARKALQEVQPSGLESLFDGPSGFLVGNVTGLTAGVLACRGAN